MSSLQRQIRPVRSTVRRRTALAVALVAGALVADLTVGVPVAGAVPASATPNASTIAPPVDYFTNQWNDPMDFSNREDLDLSTLMIQGGSASMNDGRLRLQGVGQVFFARHDPGALPTSAVRDPRLRLLDGNVYSRISFRMNSDADAAGAIGFRTCDGCADGYRYFEIFKGWHTYDLDMVNGADHEPLLPGVPRYAGTAWGGPIGLLYMAPAFNSPSKPTLTMDDFQVYAPSPSINVNLSGTAGSVELWSDTNNNAADDGDYLGGVGETANRIGVVTGNSTVEVFPGSFRPDQPVRFYTAQNGVRSAQGSVVTMPSTATPTPVVMTPSELGGTDFATEVKGDPWDMNGPADVWKTFNASTSIHDNALFGSPAGRLNDPVVVFNSGAKQIDATLYHKAVVTVSYSGEFGLADAPGGGLVGRFIWNGFDGGHQQVSDDIVVKPGQATYVVDLRTSPATAVLDPAGNPEMIGWGTGWTTFVSLFRFDPHEDPGGRNWVIDDVKLLRDEAVAPTFSVAYRDDTWAAGTIADVWADTDRSLTNGLGTLLDGGISVNPGHNIYTWDGHGVPAGSYYIHVMVRRGGREVGSTSTGQVAVGVRGAGAPPDARGELAGQAAPPVGGPTQAQLIAFFTWVLQTKFFCGVARARNITAAGNAPICNQLLGRWVKPKARKR